jgi:heparanase 1
LALQYADAYINVTLTPRFGFVSAMSSPSMVSFNFDWNTGDSWANASVMVVDLTSKRLRALTAAMSPAHLRIGGSDGDAATYLVDPTNPPVPCDPDYCLGMPRWRELLEFSKDVGVDLVFGLNLCYGRNSCRDPGFWNGTNIFQLLNYTAANNLPIGGFELGNEKEHFLTPEYTVAAFKQTRAWINQLWPDVGVKPTENPLPHVISRWLGGNPS